jgi:MFS family permease
LLRRNLRFCTYEGLVAMPIVFLSLPGNFIIAALLTQVFRLGETAFGVIVSLPAWSNVLQLVLLPALTRRWTQKTITLAFSGLHLAVWLVLGCTLHAIPIDNEAAASRLLFFAFLLASFCQAMVGVAWTSWVQEWTPGRLRGKYFGARNRLLQVATVLFLVGAGEALQRLSTDNPVTAYQVVILLAVGLRVLSIMWQWRILATTQGRHTEASRDWLEQLRTIRASPSLMAFIGFGAAFGFTANLFGPFFNVFMLEVLAMPVNTVSRLVILASVTGAVAMPAWGKMLDRFGNRPVMLFCLSAWMVPGYCWLLVTPERTWPLFPMFAWGGFISAGFILGSFNLLLKLVPPEAKTMAISLNVAATSLAAAVSPMLGGALLDLAWAFGLDRLRTYHQVAIVHHTLVLLTVLVLARVVEPKATSLSQVVGAMRSYRQIGALLGLSFLGNYTFFRRRRDPRP